MTMTKIPENVLVSLEGLLSLRHKAGKQALRSRKKSIAETGGNYASPIRGRGMDFSEVRLYQPGDDIRSIDWRVTARTGKAHTKLFTEERERPVFFVIDTGSSMQFGTQIAFKSVIAAKLAGLLAWSAAAHGDRVGGILFAGKNHEEIRPSGRKRGILLFFKKLVEWNTRSLAEKTHSATSDFYDVAVRLKRVARPGSVVYLISDFVTIDKKSEQYFATIASHCELVFINIYDKLEKFSPPVGHYMMTDGVNFEKLSISNKGLSEAIHEEFERREANLSDFCLRHGIRFCSIQTTEDLQYVLKHKLAMK